MKLLIDLSGCDMPYSSITVYSLRILRGLKDNRVKDVTVLSNTVVYETVRRLVPEFEVLPIEMSRKLSPFSVIKGYFRWRQIVKRINFDVIYLPHPFPPYHCIYNKGRIVTTILDIEGLRAYSGIKLVVFKLVYPFVMKRSHRLTTISAFVRQDVLSEYQFIDADKILPVHCSVVLGHCDDSKGSPINEPYILYVSSFLKHKNVMTLVKAFGILKDRIPHRLVLIGRENDYWRAEVLPIIESNQIASRIVHVKNSVTDDELVSYYKYADLFVHPSYMEGFGYPPIEAAILETPVLTTRETAIPEVTMDLLNYYEPSTDERKLANRILEVLQNPPSKERLMEISEIYRKEYDYRKIAKELYDELLKV